MRRVMLVDDLRLVRAALAGLPNGESGLTACGQAANDRNAVALAAGTQPHVVLMDLSIPIMDGVAAMRATVNVPGRAPGPNPDQLPRHDRARKALDSRAVGHLLKDSDRILL